MPDTTVSGPVEPLDAELRRIAHALVTEAPDAPSLDDHVPLTAQLDPSRRRHRLAVVATAAAALVLLVGLAAVAGEDHAGDASEIILAGDAGLEPAPQRLILDDGRYALPPGGDEPVRLDLAGLDPHGPPRPLPDGGHVVVGAHPVEDPPPGFNEFTDMTYGLAVVGADGRVEAEREIEPSTLLGTTGTEALLARQPKDERGEPSGPVTIVAHDLATGQERVVRRGGTFDPERMASARWAIVAGDLMTIEASYRTRPMDEGGSMVVPGSAECSLRVTDLATGDETERPLDLDCSMVLGVQVSPDGSRTALAYERRNAGTGSEVHLAFVDLPGGAVVQDRLLGHPIDCRSGACPPEARPIRYRGMAWDDASTVRVAMDDIATDTRDLIVERLAVG